jgi:hypothetical protein
MNNVDESPVSDVVSLAKEKFLAPDADFETIREKLRGIYGVDVAEASEDDIYDLLARLRKRVAVSPVSTSFSTPQPRKEPEPVYAGEFQDGNKIVHNKRPEWGIGYIMSAIPTIVNGVACQKIVANFANAGYKTLMTLPGLISKAPDA